MYKESLQPDAESESHKETRHDLLHGLLLKETQAKKVQVLSSSRAPD
jgi:hypothetical protein